MPKGSCTLYYSHKEGAIVLTIALGIALAIVQPHRRLNSYNFGAGLDFDYTTRLKESEASSIVCTITGGKCALYYRSQIVATIAARKVATKVSKSLLSNGFILLKCRDKSSLPRQD